MQRVFVVDCQKNPLMPCHPARARKLLYDGKAAVFRRYPFTIILKEREGGDVQPVALKIDPGSKTTGLALVMDAEQGKEAIWGAELTHRGEQVKENLRHRRQIRCNRRHRKTRYRPARFLNRRKSAGWLPPSLESRVKNIQTWVGRMLRFVPLTSISMELVKFDTQLMQNPEINGVEYQQGALQGYEVREYLLEKWGRQCAYCGKKDVPLEIEHLVPKSRGGSNRVSNLTLACTACNLEKGMQTAQEFGYPQLQAQAKKSLKDAAAVNATRWKLFQLLTQAAVPLEVGTGGRTKFNRMMQNYPKTHWMDAVCIGVSGAEVFIPATLRPLFIQANGREARQLCLMNKYGFPRTKAKQLRTIAGFQTGDMVRASVPSGKKTGRWVGRVAVRRTGYFRVGNIDGIPARCCQRLHWMDGYNYEQGVGAFSPPPVAGYPRQMQ